MNARARELVLCNRLVQERSEGLGQRCARTATSDMSTVTYGAGGGRARRATYFPNVCHVSEDRPFLHAAMVYVKRWSEFKARALALQAAQPERVRGNYLRRHALCSRCSPRHRRSL